jgi:ATP-dependent Lon protease
VLSKENEKDLADIPEEVRDDLTIHLVDTVDEVLKYALDGAVAELVLDTPLLWNPDVATPEVRTSLE